MLPPVVLVSLVAVLAGAGPASAGLGYHGSNQGYGSNPVSRFNAARQTYEPVKCGGRHRSFGDLYTCYRLYVRLVPTTSKTFNPNNELTLTTTAISGNLIDVPTGAKVGVYEYLVTFSGIFDPNTNSFIPEPNGAPGLEASRLGSAFFEFGPKLDDTIVASNTISNLLNPDGSVGPRVDGDSAVTGGTGMFLAAAGNLDLQQSTFDDDPRSPEGFFNVWVPNLPPMGRK